GARVDQIFSQGPDDAVAPRIDLADLIRMLAGRFQHSASRGVDDRGDAPGLRVERILASHDNLRIGSASKPDRDVGQSTSSLRSFTTTSAPFFFSSSASPLRATPITSPKLPREPA